MNRLKFFRTILISLIFITITALTGYSQDTVGTLVYKDGEVQIVRDGRTLPEDEIFIGSDIENLDLIITKSDSEAQIEINAGASPGSLLKVEPNTYCTITISTEKGKHQTNIGIISGILALKVKKLSKGNQFNVKSDAVTLGVRGTQFSVVSPPTGDFLITCRKGAVLCTDENGNKLFAKPGQVVEKRPGEIFRTIPVAISSLSEFRKNWYTERIEAFKANALKAIRYYALRYLKLYKEFTTEYAGLMREKRILNKWIYEDKNNTIGSTIEVMKEKKRIIGHLFRIKRTLFIFERIYFRLSELEEYFNEGYGRGLIKSDLTSTEFFRKFQRNRLNLMKKMSFIRYVFKLYAKRNNGSVSAGIFQGGFSSESNDFDNNFNGDDFDNNFDNDTEFDKDFDF